MEMPLSSYTKMSLPSFCMPANEAASCEMPSIMQPSPQEHVGVMIDDGVARAG